MEANTKIPTPPNLPKEKKQIVENKISTHVPPNKEIIYIDFRDEIKTAARKVNKGKEPKVIEGDKFFSKNTKVTKFTKCSFCNKEIESSIINFHMESHPSKILDWLYLGSYNNATNKKELEYANVKYVLNCAGECRNLFEKDFSYKHFKISDTPEVKITEYFEDAFKFIEEARSNNSTLFVHCQMGKSRSASFVIGYLIKHMKMSFEAAYKFVKGIRKMVFPNLGFMRQLREYDNNLKTNE